MQTRRPLAILAATAITGLGLTALATPASADTTVTITGPDVNNIEVSPGSISGTSVTLVKGTPVNFAVISQSLSDGDGACVDRGNPPGLCTVANFGDSATFEIAPGANGALVRIVDFGNNTLATFTVTYPDAPAAGGPAPVVQQFEKPATGTCDEAQPEGLNWGGASSGGWGESWAQWANEGEGGPVCTRTLAYSTSTGTWQVQ